MSGYFPPPSGGSGDGLPIADPSGVTSETAPNTVKETGTYNVVTFPADTTFLAVKLDGDDYPRLAFNVNPGNYGGIFFGDGVSDLINGDGDTTSLYWDGSELTLSGATFHATKLEAGGGGVTSNSNVIVGVDETTGVVLYSPDGSQHRLVVADNGTLSTVPFP